MTSEKCRHCGKTKDEHGKYYLICYGIKTTSFEPISNSEEQGDKKYWGCSKFKPIENNGDTFEPQSNSQDGSIRKDEHGSTIKVETERHPDTSEDESLDKKMIVSIFKEEDVKSAVKGAMDEIRELYCGSGMGPRVQDKVLEILKKHFGGLGE